MPISIRVAQTGKERDACYLVRMAVFVEEQKVPPWEEMDDLDEDATHFLADVDGGVAATARLVEMGPDSGKIGRVAVLERYRGQGVGSDLMRRVMTEGFERFGSLALDAQLAVIPFYEKLGFVAEGPVFLDAG